MANFLSPKIATVYGIDIQLHWTFLMLLLIALLSGASVFVLIVLLFVFVVMHELSHSLVSKHYRIPVKKIILFPLGGASIIDLDEVEPKKSLRIALAGPLSSIALALLFGVAWVFTSGPLSDFFQFAALINILLGVFNMLPAFPLDGGRVLKSYLEERSDDLTATKKAVSVSNYIILAFIIASIIYAVYFSGDSLQLIELSLIWDIVIVFFVYSAAQGELQSAYINKYTSKIKVSRLTSDNYITVKPTTTMARIYRMLLANKTHIIVFKKGEEYMLVSRAPANPFGKASAELLKGKVSEFSQRIPQIENNASLSKAIGKLRYEEAPMLAVVEHNRLKGLLLAEHAESIIALHMPQIIKEENKKKRN